MRKATYAQKITLLLKQWVLSEQRFWSHFCFLFFTVWKAKSETKCSIKRVKTSESVFRCASDSLSFPLVTATLNVFFWKPGSNLFEWQTMHWEAMSLHASECISLVMLILVFRQIHIRWSHSYLASRRYSTLKFSLIC